METPGVISLLVSNMVADTLLVNKEFIGIYITGMIHIAEERRKRCFCGYEPRMANRSIVDIQCF